MSERTALFPRMFTTGSELASKKKKPHVVTVVSVGPLHLPSGRLVTGDAIATTEFQPLTRTVAPGVYPVEASVVSVSKDEGRIAGVRIVFSREPVVRWEIASGGSGYPPECTSLGLFIDARTVPALQAYIDAADAEWWYDPPMTKGNDWKVACFTPDDDRPETCVLFDITAGAGGFISYWGLDAAGTPAQLATEFNFVA
jgi:hypothetical protein